MSKTRVLKKPIAGAIAIAVSLLASLPASAEAWSGDYRTIASIYPHSAGLTFNLSGSTIVAASPCPNRFILSVGMPNYNVIAAALLSAHAQGKRIQINFEETSVACDVPVNRFITES